MVEEMLGTLHQEVSEVKLVDYDQTRMEAKGCPGPKQEKEKRGGEDGGDEQLRPTLPSFLHYYYCAASDACSAVSLMMQGIWLIILDELWWLYGARVHGHGHGHSHSSLPTYVLPAGPRVTKTDPTEGRP